MLISDTDLRTLVLKNKLLIAKNLDDFSDIQKNGSETLLSVILRSGLISEEILYPEIAKYLSVPFIKLKVSSISKENLNLLPEKVAKNKKSVIFDRDKTSIKLATTENPNEELISLISQKTNQKVKVYLVTPTDLKKVFPLYRLPLQGAIDKILHDTSDSSLETAPIRKIVDLLIDYAYQDGASDIHVEPEEHAFMIRFRIDGILHDFLTLPRDLLDRVVSRIKVLARLRTDEHLSPQDGKFRFSLEDENLDIRVSIIPIADGEKVVMRLLTSKSREYSLENLGFSGDDLKTVKKALEKSYGMILSTGPTGSGKTTTIYSLIKLLNTRERNITTIEDPVEYRIKGVNQIQVNAKTNLTFANGLSSILRQDPNIIFVGEVRDSETAAIAVNAALTGHLVFSTLHTSDAVGAVPRLLDMGIEPFLLTSTVNIIIAQRLLRRICEDCKHSYIVSRKELAKNIPEDSLKRNFGTSSEIKFFQGKGCPTCHQTGYVGRAGIVEVLTMTKTIRKLIIGGGDSDQVLEAALKDGMITMFDDGLRKAHLGITTIDEVLRVTKVDVL